MIFIIESIVLCVLFTVLILSKMNKPLEVMIYKEKNLPNTELVVGDCENLPFEAETFDVVINSQSYHH